MKPAGGGARSATGWKVDRGRTRNRGTHRSALSAWRTDLDNGECENLVADSQDCCQRTAVRKLLSENCCQKIAVRVLRTGQRIAFEQSSRPQIALEAVPRFVISAEARRSQIIRFFSQQCRLLGIAMPFL